MCTHDPKVQDAAEAASGRSWSWTGEVSTVTKGASKREEMQQSTPVARERSGGLQHDCTPGHDVRVDARSG